MSIQESKTFTEKVDKLFREPFDEIEVKPELEQLINQHPGFFVSHFDGCFLFDKNNKVILTPETRAIHTKQALIGMIQEIYNSEMRSILENPNGCIEIDAREPYASDPLIEDEENDDEEKAGSVQFIKCNGCGIDIMKQTTISGVVSFPGHKCSQDLKCPKCKSKPSADMFLDTHICSNDRCKQRFHLCSKTGNIETTRPIRCCWKAEEKSTPSLKKTIEKKEAKKLPRKSKKN
jgi:hypothetical protein